MAWWAAVRLSANCGQHDIMWVMDSDTPGHHGQCPVACLSMRRRAGFGGSEAGGGVRSQAGSRMC
eukprot:343644-Rhodomonas_salina.3